MVRASVMIGVLALLTVALPASGLEIVEQGTHFACGGSEPICNPNYVIRFYLVVHVDQFSNWGPQVATEFAEDVFCLAASCCYAGCVNTGIATGVYCTVLEWGCSEDEVDIAVGKSMCWEEFCDLDGLVDSDPTEAIGIMWATMTGVDPLCYQTECGGTSCICAP